MSSIIQAEDLKSLGQPSQKEIENRLKGLKQLLFSIKQQALQHGRDRFYGFGEIAEIITPVKVAGKTIQFVYRYDPLNDSLTPIGFQYA